MKLRRPPVFADWLLQRFGLAERNPAMVGDLAEAFQDGKSALWYWRQALLAIGCAVRRSLGALAFSATVVFLRNCGGCGSLGFAVACKAASCGRPVCMGERKTTVPGRSSRTVVVSWRLAWPTSAAAFPGSAGGLGRICPISGLLFALFVFSKDESVNAAVRRGRVVDVARFVTASLL